MTFSDAGAGDTRAPYIPAINLNGGLKYEWKKLSAGISGQFVDDQFTEYYNFSNESADGAIGALPSYYTMDAFLNYEFNMGNDIRLKAFINGKNITNSIYRASRLNRASSGVFPGGFRQIIMGLNVTI